MHRFIISQLTHGAAVGKHCPCADRSPRLRPNNVQKTVRSSWEWRHCRPSGPRTAPAPDNSGAESTVKVTPGTPRSTSEPAKPTQSPLFQSARIDGYNLKRATNSRRIHQIVYTIPESMSAGVRGGGGGKQHIWAEQERLESHCVSHHRCISPSVTESELCRTVESSLHMRRDPAHGPIDRQRNAPLLSPVLTSQALCQVRTRSVTISWTSVKHRTQLLLWSCVSLYVGRQLQDRQHVRDSAAFTFRGNSCRANVG